MEKTNGFNSTMEINRKYSMILTNRDKHLMRMFKS